MIVGNRQCVSQKAHALGITPDELIALIVRQQHFRTNEEEIIEQNVRRYHEPEAGNLPDYILRFCQTIPNRPMMSEAAVA